MYPDAFDQKHCLVEKTDYLVMIGGAGPPLLLLHGFPQTHLCWDLVAAALAENHTVLAPDLRGYGGSTAPIGGPRGEGYSKREMAAELVHLMSALGHDQFAVIGHDRGARVAYRMALDHPHKITRLAVLNIVPTIEQFERMSGGPSLGYWPWYLLAQPAPLPERLLSADPAAVLDHAFDTWSSDPAAITPEHRAAYLDAMTPRTAAAICADYRASFFLDRDHDAADRANGRWISTPTLVVTGTEETQLDDAPAIWRSWAAQVSAGRVPGGHFLPEEAPDALLPLLAQFLAG
jgi:haloacetate dehalogenase